MRRGKRTVIHINFSSAEVDTVYFPQIEVVGDIAHTVERLTDALDQQPQWDFSFFDTVRKAFHTQLAEHTDDERFPLHPVRIVADTRKVMPDDGILCLDNGMYKLWYARYYRARQSNTILLDNAVKAEAPMRQFKPWQRQAVLNHCVTRMGERQDELAKALCVEAGKPIHDAKGEVSRLIDTFRIAAELAPQTGGEVLNLEISKRADGYRGFTKRVPLGACSFITPFNFPRRTTPTSIVRKPSARSRC